MWFNLFTRILIYWCFDWFVLCNGCNYLSWYVAIVHVMCVGLHLGESRCVLYLFHIQIVMYFSCIIVLLVVTCCSILILSGKHVFIGAAQSRGTVLDRASRCGVDKSRGASGCPPERGGDWARSSFGQD